MAHTGTTMDLGQSRSASAARPVGFWPAMLVVAIVIALIVAVALVVANASKASLAADRSYDAIEAQRGATTLSVGTPAKINVSGSPDDRTYDRSYDQIEAQRGGGSQLKVILPNGTYNQFKVDQFKVDHGHGQLP